MVEKRISKIFVGVILVATLLAQSSVLIAKDRQGASSDPHARVDSEGVRSVGGSVELLKNMPRTLFVDAGFLSLAAPLSLALGGMALLAPKKLGMGSGPRRWLIGGGGVIGAGAMVFLLGERLKEIVHRKNPLLVLSSKGFAFDGYRPVSWSRIESVKQDEVEIVHTQESYGVTTYEKKESIDTLFITIKGKFEYTGGDRIIFSPPTLDNYLFSTKPFVSMIEMHEAGLGMQYDEKTNTTTIGMPQMWFKAPLNKVEGLLRSYQGRTVGIDASKSKKRKKK